jgi:hypothetical protein
MTDYWKSLPKKYCELCKVWYADNRISIENHERGLKHKNMVQQKLRETAKKSREKEQANQSLNYTLMQMEVAALERVKEDDKSRRAEAAATALVGQQARDDRISSSDKNEMREEIKERKRKLQQLKKTAKRSQFWAEDEMSENSIQWVQAESDDGQVYFWNIYSGDTQWDVPDSYYTTAEYNDKYAELTTHKTPSRPMQQTVYTSQHYYPSVSHYDTAAGEQNVPLAVESQPIDEMAAFIQPPPPPAKALCPIPLVPSETAVKINSTSRRERPEQSSIKISVKVETKEEPIEEDQHVDTARPTLVAVAEPKEESVYRPPKAVGVLGPWVPVVRKASPPPLVDKKPKTLYKDLPTTELPETTADTPTFNYFEEEPDAAQVVFEEKKLPTASKKTKVVEFRKRKTNTKNVRTRPE